MSKIGIVIPVFNRLEFTQECLGILEKQKSSSFYRKNEVFTIVVDDASTDGTGEWVPAHYPGVILLKGTGDLWFSGSMNKGMKYALDELACDYILIWETDIFPCEEYFNDLQSIMEKSSTQDILSSKVMIRNQPEIIFGLGGYFDTKTGDKGLIGAREKDGPEYGTAREVDWFLGQGVLLHKSCFEKVGYFDEKVFPQYHADIDYSLRAKKAGFRIMVYPELLCWNDTEMSGISHIKKKSIPVFIRTLFSLRSNYNIMKDIRFYNRHTTNIVAYKYLLIKYIEYVGGYIKWGVLGWFGVKKSVQ
jgi:GT2 family glycosyltransferase